MSKRGPSEKAMTAARRILREEEWTKNKTRSRNLVFDLFDYPSLTASEVIAIVRQRHDDQRTDRVADALNWQLKKGKLVIGEDGLIRLGDRVRR